MTEVQKKAEVSQRRFLRWATKTMAVLTIICFVWISLEGYHNLVSREMIEKSAELIAPLTPELDGLVLEEISKKQFFDILEVHSVFVRSLGELPEESTPSAEEAYEE